MKDTKYYDKESAVYSLKRYSSVPRNYIQYFFGQRLDIVSNLVGKYANKNADKQGALEVGCADGVVISSIYSRYSNIFGSWTGIDISPQMIEVARNNHKDLPIRFVERREYMPQGKIGIIIEIGVANYADVEEELSYAHGILDIDGVYILSLAGRGSLWSIRQGGEGGFNNFHKYSEYEGLIGKYFDVLAKKPVGLYLPLVWRLPVLARMIQQFCEGIFAPFAKNLFHENIYVLRKRI